MDTNIQKSLLYKMLLIREFENTVSEYKMNNKIYGSAHCCNGEEAISAGVCSALNKEDYVITNHRPHGHVIAKGADINSLMAELFGKSTGSNGGKGGSMHINSKEYNVITATGIVGSGIPVSLGSAFASKYKNDGKVTVIFFGDGSANEGVLHECLNLASIWKLPLIFVLEHNGLAITVQTKNTSAIKDYTKLAEVYGIKTAKIDGQDVEEVYNTAKKAIDIARNGEPFFIQAKTYRFHEHAEGAYYYRMRETGYRDNEELQIAEQEQCPIKLYSEKLIKNGILSQEKIDELKEKAKQEVKNSLDYAFNASAPSVESAFENVFAEVVK